MSMTCQICRVRYAMIQPVPVPTGERVFMCLGCAAHQPVAPRRFPEGTQQTGTKRPANDHTESERANFARIAEEVQGRAALLEMMLRRMYDAFPELRSSHATAEQQQVLRDVCVALEECK